MSDLTRIAIATGITISAASILTAGIKLDNQDLRSGGFWLGGFQAGFMVTDVVYMLHKSKQEGS